MNPLWLALDLPRLPLEAHFGPSGPSPAPGRAVRLAAPSEASLQSPLPEGSGQGAEIPLAVAAAARIVACDDLARAMGVAPGMSLAAARAIAPQLAVTLRDTAREAAALEALACWAGGFTPRIVLAPHALLLEIGACLRLFGGVEKILAAVTTGVSTQGFRVHAAVATTPQGALWLAQCRVAAICLDAAMLTRALDALPLSRLDLPMAAQERLAGFGARTLSDARRLPRAGLARRIGAAVVALLARAYGELPDPRPDFVFPVHFALSLELPAPVDTADALLFAARRLTLALAGWLAVRQAGIAACALHLCHRTHEATIVDLRFAAATRDAARFERVLRERLDRLALAAPVESLRLQADAVTALPGNSGLLFEGGDMDGEGMAALVERLRARLGDARVQGLAAIADHRPECATRPVPQGRNGVGAASGARPFWLLAVPESIAERTGRPWRNGPLRLLAGPERIESGWWQEGEGEGAGDARRDYFVALTSDARWAWVFREIRAPGGWFLHGWFG